MLDDCGLRPHRPGIVATCLRASLAVLLLATAAIAADVSGHWRGDDGARFEIEQTAGAVVVTRSSSTRIYDGTITGSSVEVASDAPPAESYSLVLAGDESTLTGQFHTSNCEFGPCMLVVANVTITRCACSDDNVNSGDGCDTECRVEPCYECSGDPSVCTPVADATSCENRSACISGGTCSAGVCKGGVETAGCIDLSGAWLRTTYRFNQNYGDSIGSEILQDQADLAFFDVPSGYRNTTGSVDAATGAMEIGSETGWPQCGTLLSGMLAADGNSYGVTGWLNVTGGPSRCLPWYHDAELGLRCASGNLEPSDGCLVDSCQRCEGDPPVCVPVPDQTPCHSSDPCTVLATCESGACVASISDTCPACTACDGAGHCTARPRNNCRTTDQPRSTKLSVKHREGDLSGTLKWSWKDGAAIRIYDRGRPDLYGDVAFCLFEESTSVPTLLYGSTLNASDDPYEGLYDEDIPPGWRMDDEGGVRYSDRYSSGITSLQLEVGAAGDAGIKLKGRGVSPTPELPLPLRAQVQIEGGACFEGSYGADGVSRNANGVFNAKGTP